MFAFIMATAHSVAPTPPHRIDFIDENDRRRRFLGLLKEVPDPAGPNPNEHFHEVRPGNGEERYAGFPSDRPGQEGLPRPWRAFQEDPGWNLGT